MKKPLRLLVLLAALVLLVLLAVDDRLLLRRYTVESDKVDSPIRLALLTDYHGCEYGQDGSELLMHLRAEQPDTILLVGDMFSADGDAAGELSFFRAMTEIAPCYYVTGNHEYWEYSVPALTERIRQTGVTVLNQRCETLTVRGQTISLCGIPDPSGGASTADSLSVLDVPSEGFTLLLAHRPEQIGAYAERGFDLVVSGHAHGGQVRIPGLVNGLYAPNQGFFPQYAGGLYQVDDTALIVSRGLSRQRQWFIPRVFNRPELVLVTIR